MKERKRERERERERGERLKMNKKSMCERKRAEKKIRA